MELRRKGRVCALWKKGQTSQDDDKDVINFCREKIRRVKAQLELNVFIAIKDKRNCFYTYINNKR